MKIVTFEQLRECEDVKFLRDFIWECYSIRPPRNKMDLSLDKDLYGLRKEAVRAWRATIGEYTMNTITGIVSSIDIYFDSVPDMVKAKTATQFMEEIREIFERDILYRYYDKPHNDWKRDGITKKYLQQLALKYLPPEVAKEDGTEAKQE